MARQDVKPPFAYYGGKTTLAPTIAAMLPPHTHYVEPFAGSLAVLLAKPRSIAETVNDLDGRLVAFWRVLRDNPERLAEVAGLTPHSRAEYETATQELSDELSVENARRVWVVLTQGRSHSLAPTGWWTRKRGQSFTPSAYIKRYAARMPEAAERLNGVSIESRDALEVISDYGTEESVCIYADPPYLGSTRAKNYAHELLDDGAHHAFAEVCHSVRARLLISGYASPLYEQLFEGWSRLEVAAPTALSGDTTRTEVLWANYELRDDSLDFSTLGGDVA